MAGVLIYTNDASKATADLAPTIPLSAISSDVDADGNLDYIKIDSPVSGKEEHWRDIKNLQERSDTYDPSGNLVQRIIVTEGGKRVVMFGYEEGKLVASRTWLLPPRIAQENNRLLELLLVDEKKKEFNSFKDKGRKLDGVSKLASGKSVKKYSLANNESYTAVFVDDQTGLPVEEQVFVKNGSEYKLNQTKTEKYKKLHDESGQIFKYDKTSVKEMPADTASDNLGNG